MVVVDEEVDDVDSVVLVLVDDDVDELLEEVELELLGRVVVVDEFVVVARRRVS